MAYYETKETHKKEDLRTRYYVGTYEGVRDSIISVAREMNYVVTNIDDVRHEILLDGNASIVCTVTSFGRYEQGVDLNVMTAYAYDLGSGRRLIVRFYKALGLKVKLKGVSLHP